MRVPAVLLIAAVALGATPGCAACDLGPNAAHLQTLHHCCPAKGATIRAQKDCQFHHKAATFSSTPKMELDGGMVLVFAVPVSAAIPRFVMTRRLVLDSPSPPRLHQLRI